jgi:hypothetical protein
MTSARADQLPPRRTLAVTRVLSLGFVLSFAGWLAGVALLVWALHRVSRQRSERDHLAFLGVLLSGLSMFATWMLVDGE